jgi:imidazolonepropionase
LSHLTGSVTAGKLASLIITRPLPDLAFIPYSHHTPFISRIILKGREIS